MADFIGLPRRADGTVDEAAVAVLLEDHESLFEEKSAAYVKAVRAQAVVMNVCVQPDLASFLITSQEAAKRATVVSASSSIGAAGTSASLRSMVAAATSSHGAPAATTAVMLETSGDPRVLQAALFKKGQVWEAAGSQGAHNLVVAVPGFSYEERNTVFLHCSVEHLPSSDRKMWAGVNLSVDGTVDTRVLVHFCVQARRMPATGKRGSMVFEDVDGDFVQYSVTQGYRNQQWHSARPMPMSPAQVRGLVGRSEGEKIGGREVGSKTTGAVGATPPRSPPLRSSPPFFPCRPLGLNLEGNFGFVS
jgi:hypothetical protein